MSKKIIIIGGVAAGPKTASKIMRMHPNAEVIIIEKGEFLSYAGCGLPYYISGTVESQKELMCTPIGVIRDPDFFKKVKNITVYNRTEATKISPETKEVTIKNLQDGTEKVLQYDKLIMATGASPVVPPIPGVNLKNVFTLHGVEDAENIKNVLANKKALDVVIIGGGLIGVEVTEAFVERGCRVTMVEMQPQILRIVDWEMAKHVEKHMESHGVKVLTETRVEAIEGTDKVEKVITNKGSIQADIVVMAIGVRPNVKLAKEAGIEIGTTGAIKVNEKMQTSNPDIYAAGDCAETKNLITGEPCFVPLGSTANKQGRVAAVNICGGNDKFEGVLGSGVCKVFEFCVARTGLSEDAAIKAGYEVITVLSPGPDKAHFMPTAKSIFIKLIADKKSRKLIGLQAIGPGDASKRTDIAAVAITAGMTVDQLANIDLCYAPPFSPAMDNIITAANIARNKIDGYLNCISPVQLYKMMQDKEDFYLVDVSSPQEFAKAHLPGAKSIPLGAIKSRLSELEPKDKKIVLYCKSSLRGYEASLILRNAGFTNVTVLGGGIMMWLYEFEK